MILTPRTAFELLGNVIRLCDPTSDIRTANPADPTRVETYSAKWWLNHHLFRANSEYQEPTVIQLDYTFCGLSGERITLSAPPLTIKWFMGPGDKHPTVTTPIDYEQSGVTGDPIPDIQSVAMTILREAERYDGQDSDEPPGDYCM